MKTYTLLLITVIILSSCGLGKEFNSLKDCYDSIKYMTYDDIVKAWGEPDYRSDVDINPSSTVQQEQGVNVNITVICIWNRPKVKVRNSNCVTLLFNVVELAGGVMVPSTVRGYEDCDSKSNSTTSSDKQNNSTPPSVAEAVDSSILISKQGNKIADNEITTKEVAELEKYKASHLTEISKIDGDYSIENGFSKLDIKDGSVTLNLIGQTYISAIIKRDSPNNYTLYFWEFIESNGLKAENFKDYSESTPIATIEDINGELTFKWIGLYNRVTKKREYLNDDTDIKSGVYHAPNNNSGSDIKKIDKGSLTHKYTAQEYFEMGSAESEKHDYSKAIEDFDNAIKINPKWNSGMSYVQRAIAKYNIQDYKGVLADLNKVNPDNYSVVNLYKGNAKYELHDFRGAIVYFDAAIKEADNDGERYYKRALAKQQIGDKEGACLDWKKAVELGNKDSAEMISKFCN